MAKSSVGCISMSRIGNLPVVIPPSVTVTLADGNISVKGPKGELMIAVPQDIKVIQEAGNLVFSRPSEDRFIRARHGLARSLVNNMILGVTDGFSKQLVVEGVGFKVQQNGNNLKMALGFSHDIEYSPPDGVTLTVDGNNINVTGADKQKVGQAAADIREFKKPEPYKGKGIHYSDEYIIRKSGKSATAAAA